jgi:hypothetical protein
MSLLPRRSASARGAEAPDHEAGDNVAKDIGPCAVSQIGRCQIWSRYSSSSERSAASIRLSMVSRRLSRMTFLRRSPELAGWYEDRRVEGVERRCAWLIEAPDHQIRLSMTEADRQGTLNVSVEEIAEHYPWGAPTVVDISVTWVARAWRGRSR